MIIIVAFSSRKRVSRSFQHPSQTFYQPPLSRFKLVNILLCHF